MDTENLTSYMYVCDYSHAAVKQLHVHPPCKIRIHSSYMYFDADV
jgi:hypothetical protein